MSDELAQRLEMLLVLQWLDEGRPSDGRVVLSVTTAGVELGVGSERAGVLSILTALGDLEARRVVQVALEGPVRRDPVITLSDSLRRDAESLFHPE